MTTVSITVLRNRIMSAVRGAIVADASTMGLHWIYDPFELKERMADATPPEFLTPPRPNFYNCNDFPRHYKAGMSSPYGELLIHTCQHVASVGTNLSGATTSKALYTWATSFGGRPDAALTKFVENIKAKKDWTECGADDDQAMIYAKVVPVTCLYIGKEEREAKLAEIIRVHQNNDRAVAFGLAASRLLETVLLGSSLEDALGTCYEREPNEEVKQAYDRARQAAATGDTLEQTLLKVSHEILRDDPQNPFYDKIGRACSLPQAFIGPMALFYKPDMDYVTAVRENILAAGDNCSRAIFIGAIYGALGGDPPKEWVNKCHHMVEDACVSMAKQIATLATTPKK
eukprot:scaffold528_cov165-Amphora_coffeaeformis.AAC.17